MARTLTPLFHHLCREWEPVTLPLALPPTFKSMRSPKMHIDNVCRSSSVFRKVHIEYAQHVQMDMEIVHSVAFPHSAFDLPILGMDLVCIQGVPTMGILDLSPVLPEQQQEIQRAFQNLQSLHPIGVGKRREIPAWGRRIFSEQCVFLDKPSIALFTNVALDTLALYKHFALRSAPQTKTEPLVRAAHRLYCVNQLQNQRTRAVLAASFGADVAESYMREVMFDAPEAVVE